MRTTAPTIPLLLLALLLAAPGCRSWFRNADGLVRVEAPSIDEETETVRGVSRDIKKAADDIDKATDRGRDKAPGLGVWHDIESGVDTVRSSAYSLDGAVQGLEKAGDDLQAYEAMAGHLSEDNRQLADKLARMESDQTRKALLRLSVMGAGIVGLGILLLWVDRRWALAVGLTGAGMLLAARVLQRVLALVDLAVTIAMFAVPLAVAGWLVYRYRRHIFGLVSSVQSAKKILPDDVRRKFGDELSKEQDADVKRLVAGVRARSAGEKTH